MMAINDESLPPLYRTPAFIDIISSQTGCQAQQVAQAPAFAADEDDAVEHEQERHEGDEQEEGDAAQSHQELESGDERGQVKQCAVDRRASCRERV